ncbi:MAG: hypothetical protein AAGA69_05790, partial [Pseudomonadota bacterium]
MNILLVILGYSSLISHAEEPDPVSPEELIQQHHSTFASKSKDHLKSLFLEDATIKGFWLQDDGSFSRSIYTP